jgi:pantothenate kinase
VERVKQRNKCIPGYTPEEIAVRAEKVDRANALTVLESKKFADIVVEGNLVVPQEHTKSANSMHKHNKSLSHVSMKDVEEAVQRDTEWANGIVTRPRGESINSRARSESIASVTSDPRPPPAASYVGTWEAGVAKQIAEAVTKSNSDDVYMVALAGYPGSGKSVSAFLLQYELEKLKTPTMIMPHDGYHYPLDYLKSFPDSEDLVYRRGAPDTFDPLALHRDLSRIQSGVDEAIIKLPAFDHARGDPEPDTHIFDRHVHKVVICEGLYVLHDKDGWEDIAGLFDLRVFIDANVDDCIERVKIRNQCIPGYTPDEIAIRTEKVDRINAMTVLNSKRRADMVVDSIAASNKN